MVRDVKKKMVYEFRFLCSKILPHRLSLFLQKNALLEPLYVSFFVVPFNDDRANESALQPPRSRRNNNDSCF